MRYRQVSAAPVKDADGKIIGSVSVVRDVTESKKVEEALVESEQLYHTVFDNSQDGFQLIELIYDEQGKPIDHNFLKVNQAYEKIIGVKAEDILDKTAKYISPNQEPHWLEVPDRVAKTGIPEHVELYNKDINKTLDCYYFPYAKNLVGTLFRDITERKKNEEAIRRQASLIDLSPDAIMVTSFEGVISFWNKGAEKLYGWTISEAIGQIAHDLLKTKSPESISIIKAQVKIYGCWKGELYHKTKDGKEVAVQSWWLADKDEHGEVKSILESNMDITNRKRLEKQLQDAERLAAIGATAGMVGHDIRNPLQAITSDVYLAKTELASTPESEEKKTTLESLQEIEKNVDYINKIVVDLQDFARPLNPHPEVTNLKHIIDDLLTKSGLPNNVKVSVKVETEKVVADSTFINRIMYNLVNNAVQAMPDGGKLTIHSFKETNDVIISVKDTGVGIPESVRGKLFTPMFTTKAKGQGFGLAVIKRMTESLGGTVTFESQEGKGTTFIVRLPQSPQ